MNIASLTGIVIASRRPVSRAVAIARLSPSSVVRMRASIASRNLASPRHSATTAACDRRLHGLDAAGDETGRTDALEIHVAAEIVAAGSQWRERRPRPRFQFDKTADLGRGALPHRQPDPFSLVVTRGPSICATRSTKRSVRSRISRASTKPESCTEYIGRARTLCAISAVFHVAAAKPDAIAAISTATGNIFCRRSKNAAAESPAAASAVAQRSSFMAGREIKRDACAERHRHPWQKPAGARLRHDPFAYFCSKRRPRIDAGGHEAARLRRPMPWPGPGVPLRPASSPTTLCH